MPFEQPHSDSLHGGFGPFALTVLIPYTCTSTQFLAGTSLFTNKPSKGLTPKSNTVIGLIPTRDHWTRMLTSFGLPWRIKPNSCTCIVCSKPTESMQKSSSTLTIADTILVPLLVWFPRKSAFYFPICPCGNANLPGVCSHLSAAS